MKKNTQLKIRRLPEQDRSKATMNAILEAAADLFGQSGIDMVSITKISIKAGISKPALYRYFPNKQSIIRKLAEQTFQEYRELLVRGLSEESDSLKNLLERSLSEYCELHCNELYRIKLRAAIFADPVLSNLDLVDTRQNAALLSEFLISRFPHADKTKITNRALLFTELTDSLVRLVSKVSKKERLPLIIDFIDVLLSGLEST